MPPRFRISRVVLAAAILAGSVLALEIGQPLGAFACSCALLPTPAGGWTRDTLLEQADVVFRGRIIASSQESSGHPAGQYEVTFQASEIWKGPESGTFTVQAGQGGGDCTIAYRVGQEWLIYGHNDPGEGVNASICSRTTRIPGAQSRSDLAALGAGTLVIVPTPVPEQARATTAPTSESDPPIPTAERSSDDGRAMWLFATGLTIVGIVLVFSVATFSRRRRGTRPS